MAAALAISDRLWVADSAWTNGTVERIMREAIWTMKAILNECRKPLAEWIATVPAVQWALNAPWRRRMQRMPKEVILGRPPRAAFAALAEETYDGW